MLHGILDDDHIQWHPSFYQALHHFFTLLLIWILLPNLTFYLIARGFHRTVATGAACQQRTLTLPDTCSCPTLGLASVLMLRPISTELVLFPDFWVSNIPRYFCFYLLTINQIGILIHFPENPKSDRNVTPGEAKRHRGIFMLFTIADVFYVGTRVFCYNWGNNNDIHTSDSILCHKFVNVTGVCTNQLLDTDSAGGNSL